MQNWRGVDQGNARVAPNWNGDRDAKIVRMWSKWDENVFSWDEVNFRLPSDYYDCNLEDRGAKFWQGAEG